MENKRKDDIFTSNHAGNYVKYKWLEYAKYR